MSRNKTKCSLYMAVSGLASRKIKTRQLQLVLITYQAF